MSSRTVTLTAVAVLAAVALSLGAGCSEKPKEATAVNCPKLTLANDAIKLTVYLPDPEKGFYRATRFDRSGLIARAEFGNHTAYGPFRAKFDPMVNDNVCGPAEEFDMDAPPGFADAKPGEPFVKIGVGVLERPDDKKYDFFRLYKIVKLPEWKVTSGRDWVEFRQVLAQGLWGYEYTKRVQLTPESDQAGFAIFHTLKNTGTCPIDTVMYCHNFTILDDDPIGPDYLVHFPFEATPSGTPVGPAVFGKLQAGEALPPGLEGLAPERTVRFPHLLKDADPVWCQFAGIDAASTCQCGIFAVMNWKKGVSLVSRGNQAPEMFRLYAISSAVCPEPFVRVKVAPGEEKSWGTVYEFFEGKSAPVDVKPSATDVKAASSDAPLPPADAKPSATDAAPSPTETK
jgi:hypothetical protein